MRKSILIRNWFTVLSLSIIAVGISYEAKSENIPIIRLQSFIVPDDSQARVSSVGHALDFQDWPKTEQRRVVPRIDKSLLSEPGLVTRENISYEIVDFRGNAGGAGEWSWGRLVPNPEPLPTKLPVKRKENLLEHLSPELRTKPGLSKRFVRGVEWPGSN